MDMNMYIPCRSTVVSLKQKNNSTDLFLRRVYDYSMIIQMHDYPMSKEFLSLY